MALVLLSSACSRGVATFVRIKPRLRYLANAFTANDCEVGKHPDPRYVNVRNAPGGFNVDSAVVYPRFLTEAEGKSLIREASKRLKRRRFENGHWDSVISRYREVELSTAEDFLVHNPQDVDVDSSQITDATLPLFASVIRETRRKLAAHHLSSNDDGKNALSNNIRWLPCHVIDLAADGNLDAHVDSVKFSGEIVAGLSLLGDSIMRLRPSSKEWESEEQHRRSSHHVPKDCSDSTGYVDLYLPQLSLYVLSGMSRYSYTHELLPSGSSFEFLKMKASQYQHEKESEEEVINDVHENMDVIRGRRLSIIFRDAHHDCNS